MQLSHTLGATSAVFDEPNLVSAAGLVPVVALAEAAGLRELADAAVDGADGQGRERRVEGGLAGGGMVAGADSIEDMGCCGTAGWAGCSPGRMRPSTLGSFLRAFTFGHVRQLDAVAAVPDRSGRSHAAARPCHQGSPAGAGVVIDVDDTIVEVHGYAKQGAGFGYSEVRGLERAAGHRGDPDGGAGDRGAAAAEGVVRVAAGRQAAGRRRRAQVRAGCSPDSRAAAAGGLGVLRPRRGRRRDPAGGCDVSVTVRQTRR